MNYFIAYLLLFNSMVRDYRPYQQFIYQQFIYKQFMNWLCDMMSFTTYRDQDQKSFDPHHTTTSGPEDPWWW